ncbi:hypothetical protein LMG26857_01771 [Achromobacter anxifer]|uniref:hypothetical protein n=1 Tax=Achromobacter anxifer TaxID=1287737 RepID=UPI00155D4930|nr:hypothetical protein [Achromobacter anxifer]CAB5512481.1 hypothetical protein LMG26857_01771 [Achromobacter anxifer]
MGRKVIAPGTVCVTRLGWPGNDWHLVVVVGYTEDGDYKTRYASPDGITEHWVPRNSETYWIEPLTEKRFLDLLTQGKQSAKDVNVAYTIARQWAHDQAGDADEPSFEILQTMNGTHMAWDYTGLGNSLESLHRALYRDVVAHYKLTIAAQAGAQKDGRQ